MASLSFDEIRELFEMNYVTSISLSRKRNFFFSAVIAFIEKYSVKMHYIG